MPSLKEVKNRISSVRSTRKITSAMKMVASSKLHRAQQAIESMRPYERELSAIMSSFITSMEGEVETPYAAVRDVKRAVIVLLTSNSSLCGAFNANAIKAFRRKVAAYQAKGIQVVRVYALGSKAEEAVRKAGFDVAHSYAHLLDHPAYAEAAAIAQAIMESYAADEIDEATLIYHHFKSAGSQILTEETFLPVSLKAEKVETSAGDQTKGLGSDTTALDFIVEPSKEEVVRQLVPKSLYLKVFTALLDSLASEHAARVIAMQLATDNADELLRQLTLTYNKTRQQAITTELLDIVGGSMK